MSQQNHVSFSQSRVLLFQLFQVPVVETTDNLTTGTSSTRLHFAVNHSLLEYLAFEPG